MPTLVSRSVSRPARRVRAAALPAALVVLGAALLTAVGCERDAPELAPSDLTPGERLYVERVVTLERVRALALVDRPRGNALLDSLAAAWGDSVQPELLAGLGGDPVRGEAVHALLLRMVAAEQDSLLWAPDRSRLGLPLPDPDRPGPEHLPEIPSDPDAARPRLDPPTDVD